MTLDLDRYFARIGWDQPVPPTFATVAGLLRAHMMAIPFENLDVLLGSPPSLELADLAGKLIERRRGGYCYEHATLFQAVLERLGFAVQAHAARVTMVGTKQTSPRTHMLLSVELPEGAFVLDPGFGGLAPLVPVPLDGVEVRSRGDTCWLERDRGETTLKVRTPERVITASAVELPRDDQVIDAWVTSLTPEYPIDFVLANHFTSTHPRSPFTQRLLARAFVDDDRVTVMNRDVTVGGVRRQLADRAELGAVLRQYFGIELDVSQLHIPSVPEWE